MNLGLKNKIAVVTGGSAGLGKAIALGLAREGAKIAISGRRRDVLDEAAGEIVRDTGADVLTLAGDMTRAEEAGAFIDQVVARWDTIHILVNNVGQAFRGRLEALRPEDWRRAFEVNLLGAVHCASRVAPVMRRRKWGRIINISALSGKEPGEDLIASSALKAGLINFTKTLSRELAGDNILVNCVSPGLIESPQNDDYFSPGERAGALSGIPLQRFGNPEELADAVVFLCSERAGYITGVNLIVDGGSSRGI